jgi:hypothetical protein
MQHLCARCSSLSIKEVDANSIDDLPMDDSTTLAVCCQFQENLQDLVTSSEGANGSKKCDLCALLLWSWQHAQSCTQDIPAGQSPFLLMLHSNQDGFSMFLRCGERDGHPLKLSVGSGQLHPSLQSNVDRLLQPGF